MDNVGAISRLARVYIAIAFVYLLVGTLILAADLAGVIKMEHDPIFVLELYGFVSMIIFGLSYIFAPGLSHSVFANYKSVVVELATFNIGIILVFLSMSGLFGPVSSAVMLPALLLLVLGVLIHIANIFTILFKGKRISPLANGK
ncbi:MAG: hypothetical protein M1544_02535 [Candidatus Marsarchaeota archaeon]|nr:hypothetical protein [Candidatus Marsarchaeota archaeon]MCL5102209.1 hypothetical protein [Candidatus Marsarchaeota archaeon]